MALIQIRVLPDPVLRQKAKKVRSSDSSVRRLIADMLDTMHAASGVGLAAPQVGIPLRVIVIEVPDEEAITLLNPEVIKREGERLLEEACLSIPGYRGEIKRAVSVKVRGRDPQGKEVRLKAEGLLAQALEHEIDHLNGILYIDHLESKDRLFRLEPGLAPEAEGGL